MGCLELINQLNARLEIIKVNTLEARNPHHGIFIPLEAALPVPDGFSQIKSASGYIRIVDGSLIPRYDSLLFVFHQESFNTNPFPRLDTAFSALSGCVRYKAFQLWSEHVGTFHKQPLLLNSPVGADECKIYFVQLGENEEVFGVHSSSSAAIRIPIKEISSSQTYKQLRSNPESGLDPRIIMSPEYGGSTFQMVRIGTYIHTTFYPNHHLCLLI